jgi:hypothetical protein
LPGLSSNHYPPDLRLLSSSPHPAQMSAFYCTLRAMCFIPW